MHREELIKILENGIKAIKSAETDMNLARCLDIMGGICKHESLKIQEALTRKIDDQLSRNYQDLQNQKLVDILKD